jgi:hypothetical protein
VSTSSTGFRTRDQVFNDLAKALGFTQESLDKNRDGILASDQLQRQAIRCIVPAMIAATFFVVPFLFWIAITSAQQQVPFTSAVPILLSELIHLSDSIELHGKFGAFLRLGSLIVSVGFSAFVASRFPLALYFDLLEGKVVTREGRVNASEEQVMRSNGRDPIEKYFFDVKLDRYEVSLAAYRAVENGGLYSIYLLPRSQVLVALEPKSHNLASRSPAS